MNNNITIKKCLHCGKEFEINRHNTSKKYCSYECKVRYNYHYLRAGSDNKPKKQITINYICQNCGNILELKIEGYIPTEQELNNLVCQKCKKPARQLK